MDKKNQFIQFGLGMLGYQSKQDLIENLFIKSIYDTYSRIDKNVGIENDIRDRFVKDFYFTSPYLKKWIDLGILKLDWEGQVFKNREKLGRTDIDFFISGFGSFVIECKRLKNASPKYINDGLNRFINKEYSKNESYAGMIGFIIEGNINNICTSLMEKCKQVNFIESEFFRSKNVDSESSFNTSHKREGTDEINIYHLFLEFNME
jgi:hypothetical protein